MKEEKTETLASQHRFRTHSHLCTGIYTVSFIEPPQTVLESMSSSSSPVPQDDPVCQRGSLRLKDGSWKSSKDRGCA